MIVEKLAIQSFMGYSDRVDLDFRGKKTISIVGANESGKSSILQAISYAIYGKTRADNEFSLVNSFSNTPLVVEIALKLADGSKLEITRGRTKKNEAILKVAGQGGRSRELNQYIIDRIGLAYDDFIALSYFVQGDIHQFMTNDKRSYFQRWTSGLSYWKNLEDEASAKLSSANYDLTNARTSVKAAKDALANEEEAVLDERVKKQKLRKFEEQVEIRSQQVITLETKLQKDQDKQALRDNVEGLQDRLEDLELAIKSKDRAIENIKEEMVRVSNGVCPILTIKCGPLKKKGEKKYTNLSKLVESEKQDKQKLLAKQKACQEKLAEAKKQVTKKHDPELKRKLSDARRQYHYATGEAKRASVDYARASVALESIRKAKKAIDKLKLAEETASDLVRKWQFIKYMCGRSGIPSVLIQNELNRVQDRCNWVMERLDYPKRMKFSSFRELQSYEQVCPKCGGEEWSKGTCRGCGASRPRKRKDEPTITVLDGNTERPFALESGGAQVLQSFAARMAGSLFRASMTGVPVRMVMLDELFAMLDAHNRQKLMGLVIDKLATEFGLEQQFIVSHHDDVVSAVSDTLYISKQNGKVTAKWI